MESKEKIRDPRFRQYLQQLIGEERLAMWRRCRYARRKEPDMTNIEYLEAYEQQHAFAQQVSDKYFGGQYHNEIFRVVNNI